MSELVSIPKVLIDSGDDYNHAHLLVTDNDLNLKIPLHKIIGVSFEIRCEIMRDHIDGKLEVVLKQKYYDEKFRQKWFWVFIQIILYFVSGFYLFGLFTASVSSVICTLLIMYWFRRRSVTIINEDGDEVEVEDRVVHTIEIPLPRFISIILTGNVMAALLLYTLRLLARVHAFSVLSLFLDLSVAPFLCILFTPSCYILFLIFPIPIGLSKFCYRHLVDRIVLPSPPTPRYPVVVHYNEDTIQELVKLRQEMYSVPEMRCLARDQWVGNATIEAIFIYALPTSIYNNPKFRQTMFVLINYMIPLYSLVRGVGALVPHLANLSFLLSADIGLNFIKGIVDANWRRLCIWVFDTLKYVGSRLPLYSRVLELYVRIRSRLEPLVVLLWKGTVMLNRFVFSYLIPNNIYFQYLQNRMILLQVIALSSCLFARLINYVL
jgi:hypothetical protein